MRFTKFTCLISTISLLAMLLVGCGASGKYIGDWAEDKSAWDGGFQITFFDDGTYEEGKKDLTARRYYGKWETYDKGVTLIPENGEEMKGFIDENGFLNLEIYSDFNKDYFTRIYRKQK